MNRKQKIIVSITGIVIVVLALLGLTYAYFVTQIQGNDNDNSIEVTTANLRLVYRDGTPTILSKTNIQPGDTIGSKTFTVTNEGNKTVDNYVVYLESVTNSFVNKNDVTYILNCTSSISDKTCDGANETKYPSQNKILVSNSINVNEVQTYEIFVYYKDNGTDQSIDMGKEISGKLNIYDPKSINPYATISGTTESSNNTLAYNIINNAKQGLNGTTFVNTPPTKVAEEISGTNEKVLSITNDDYGTSYYFRGSVKNNYLNYSGMCWRIVRIEGDGSVKLILASSQGECQDPGKLTSSSGIISTESYQNLYYILLAFLNHQSIPSNEDGEQIEGEYKELNQLKLKNDFFHYNPRITETYYYDEQSYDENTGNVLSEIDLQNQIDTYGTTHYYNYVGKRLIFEKKATLIESSLNFQKIELLTADEVAFAGGTTHKNNLSFYLTENGIDWWTDSVAGFNLHDDQGDNDYVFIAGSTLFDYYYQDTYHIRPSITLITNVKITTGNGTQTNPYVINMES